MTRILLGIALSAAMAAGCAGSGGARQPADCDTTPIDTTYRTRGPTFRQCAVDRPARRLSGGPQPNFVPPAAPEEGCLNTQIELVVDTAGVPVPGSIRLVRTNAPLMADAVMQVAPAWRYRPAEKDGQRVGQLVSENFVLEIRLVRVPAGSMPTRPTGLPGSSRC